MTAPTGDDALREALVEVLAGLPVRPDRCGAVDIQGAESLAADLLPAVLRYGRETAAAELRAAADWLNTDPDKGGAPYISGKDTAVFPDRLDIARAIAWAVDSICDRAATLDPT